MVYKVYKSNKNIASSENILKDKKIKRINNTVPEVHKIYYTLSKVRIIFIFRDQLFKCVVL